MCMVKKLSLILVIQVVTVTFAFELKCPVSGAWRLREKGFNCSSTQYVCLLQVRYRLQTTYKESCDGLDISSIGSKLIYEPNFNKAQCSWQRYQPFPFSTDGSSMCIYRKSFCNEDGQFIFHNGSFSSDTTCGCNSSKMYTFVTKPRNICFCIPSEEDCSCYKRTRDYKDADFMNTSCSEITTKPLPGNNKRFTNRWNKTKVNMAGNTKDTIHRLQCVYTTLILLIVMVVSFILYALITDEFKKSKKERQKRIKELFEKDESGNHHFARVIFLGKEHVGKTSLMNRLLWLKQTEFSAPKSTDGINVKKCNINIENGKWSKCDDGDDEDDDLLRLIQQVNAKKKENVPNNSDHTNNSTPKLPAALHHEHSPKGSFIVNEINESSIESPYKSDDTDNDKSSYAADRTMGIDVKMAQVITKDKNLNNAESCESNLIPPKNKSVEKEKELTKIDSEKSNDQMTTLVSKILQRKNNDQSDMLAFCWLWDFAGQIDFYATHQAFLSTCAVYVLVTDNIEFSKSGELWTDLDTSAKYVQFWFDAIHCYWSSNTEERLDPPIIVVCTNKDKWEESNEQNNLQSRFSENLGIALGNHRKKFHLRRIHFVSNTEDKEDVFIEIQNDISEQAMTMKDWGRECPLKWLLFQKVLMKVKVDKNPISRRIQLKEIAQHKDIGITDDDEFNRCLQYYHDIGTIIYFDEDILRDSVILDPLWLVKAFRCLVSHEIDEMIKILKEWQMLKDTGKLLDCLINRLFDKEPELHFVENKSHLLEVMKKFDIIVNLKDSKELYMPCMMESIPFQNIQKQFLDKYRTSWLCLQFDFLPPAIFNHIIAWYIREYNVSWMIDKDKNRKRKALYRQIGIFNIRESEGEQLVVCNAANIVAIQIWNSEESDNTYGKIVEDLCNFVWKILKRYHLQVTFTISFKCKEGEKLTIDQKTIEDLLQDKYRCLEHECDHLSDDLLKAWDCIKKKTMMKNKFNRQVVFIPHGDGYGYGYGGYRYDGNLRLISEIELFEKEEQQHYNSRRHQHE